jgi:predicted ATPase
VPLAPLVEAGLVLPTIARVLGLRESGGQPLGELLQRALRGRRLLLVLDNCEHVLAGVSAMAALLEGCPRLVVLATSRAPLRVRGEHEYPVAPLAVPAFDRLVTLDEATRSPAVRLFVERAQAASPAFALTAANASPVAAICGRLDGLPLALELAAPRIKLLPPNALLGRLHHTLPLLTGGGRDMPARQQTLRATIAWSYGLLSAHEQRLFARLSVFAGCSLEAVEAVCNAEGELDVLESVAALVEQSLLRSEAGPEDEPRFRMLQTIREYAAAQLEAGGKAEETRRRHAAYYLSQAEEAAPELTGPEQVAWLERLERDLDNLRAALGWAREHSQITSGLRLAGALARFWRERGYGSEGLGWLAGFIARMDMLDGTEATGETGGTDGVAVDEVPAVVRARAVFAGGWLAAGQGDYSQAVPWLERAVALYHAAGESIGAIHALSALAGVTFDQGAVRDALARYHECAALARAAQDQGELARALGNAGEMYYHLDDLPRATECYEEALAVARRSGRVEVEAAQLGNLGNVARRQGDLRRSATLHWQALELKQVLGYRRQIAITLEDLAALAVAEGRLERAAYLLGAATELRATIGSPQGVPEQIATEQVVAEARPALGEEAWAAALAAGQALPLAQVIADALGEPVAEAAGHSSSASYSAS